MNESLQTSYPGFAGGAALAEQRNRVLRNTYWLLALSLVTTMFAAVLFQPALMGKPRVQAVPEPAKEPEPVKQSEPAQA